MRAATQKQDENIFVQNTDWYSLKAIYNDAGLYIQLKILEIETEVFQKFIRHFTTSILPKQLSEAYSNIQNIYKKVFKAGKFSVCPDGALIFKYKKDSLFNFMSQEKEIQVKLESESFDQCDKLKEIIKKLKAQNKKQAEEIAELKKKKKKNIDEEIIKKNKEEEMPINFYSSPFKSEQFFKKKPIEKSYAFDIGEKVEGISGKKIRLEKTSSLKQLTIDNKTVLNSSRKSLIISPILTSNSKFAETLEITILSNPEGLTIGTMSGIDIGQNRTLNEDQQVPKGCIALSSQRVRTQKKEYTYRSQKFEVYQKILLKVTDEKVYFGNLKNKPLQFNRFNSDHKPFIQIDPGCSVYFASPISI